MELSGYKCHAFLDWRFVTDDDGRWTEVCNALNGAGYWAMQAKWDEMFAPKVEEVKVEKKKRVTRKKVACEKKVAEKKETSKKPRAKKKAE
ncbi:MAG: hypothetical protein EHM81_03475 [Chloroflexi bacterium]|nr:MAG: hypothetical protein EHM81_03475 [Chloroflexota bacterium]